MIISELIPERITIDSEEPIHESILHRYIIAAQINAHFDIDSLNSLVYGHFSRLGFGKRPCLSSFECVLHVKLLAPAIWLNVNLYVFLMYKFRSRPKSLLRIFTKSRAWSNMISTTVLRANTRSVLYFWVSVWECH